MAWSVVGSEFFDGYGLWVVAADRLTGRLRSSAGDWADVIVNLEL